jgi:hypothetical protein
VLSVMESLTSSSTSLSELEGISERIVEKLREAGIENVERILELGEEKLKEIPGIGDKTAAKIMDAARDLFEEVEIEVPEGMELPTAIRAPGRAQASGQPAQPSELTPAPEEGERATPAEPAVEELAAGEAAEQAPAPEAPGKKKVDADSPEGGEETH